MKSRGLKESWNILAMRENIAEYAAKLPIMIRRFLNVEIVVEVKAVGGRNKLVLVDNRIKEM